MAVSDETRPTYDMSELAISVHNSSSISNKVRAFLRKEILCGRLQPGERIVESRLARQLQIGQPTVREALVALEHDGLVVRKPNRGCTVTKLSLEEIDHIFHVRLALEPLAVELAIENLSSRDRTEVANASQRLRDSAFSGNIESWNQCDLEFHEMLWRLSRNPILERVLAQIMMPFFAFSKIIFFRDHPNDLMWQSDIHGRIASALLSGKKELARQTTHAALNEFWQLWKSLSEHDKEQGKSELQAPRAFHDE